MKRVPSWEGDLGRLQRETVSLLKRKRPEEAELPIIVNFVATTSLLPQNTEETYTLPLMAISTKWGCSQYAPNLFVANIIKIRDSTAASTVLLHSSGIMVVVSGQSTNHARDVSQYVRLCIENTQCMMKRTNPETGEVEVYEGTLKGRTTFKECSIHNIVGHGNVGMKIDLQALVDAAPECWKWFPDLFPAAKGKIWLTESNQCECAASGHAREDEELEQYVKGTKPKKQKCKCAVKVLVFDTGQVVITGGRAIEEINAIFKRIRNLAPHFENTDQDVVPKEDRFYKRLSSMMVPVAGDETTSRNKVVKAKQVKTMDIVASIIAGITIEGIATRPEQPNEEEGVTPLMRLAQDGRVQEVEMILLIDPSEAQKVDANGKTARERLEALPERTEEMDRILDLLK